MSKGAGIIYCTKYFVSERVSLLGVVCENDSPGVNLATGPGLRSSANSEMSASDDALSSTCVVLTTISIFLDYNCTRVQ